MTEPNREGDSTKRFAPKKWWKSWKWLALCVFLLLLLALAAQEVSQWYAFWDVGSDSWSDHFKGDGWQFERGAATVGHDQFGDNFSTVRYLPQGWKPAQSMWFYNTTQGSDLMPYDFFMVLEQPGKSQLFRSAENLNYYRYLPQKATISNPDGLAVGFVKDRYQGTDYLGFTCAACHTAQLNYQGTGIRIDGGPASADMDSFMKGLEKALRNTMDDKDVQKRFVKNVIARGHYSSADAVVKDLEEYTRRMYLYDAANDSSQPYGYSRLDAFGRIYNRVLEHVVTQDELKTTLAELMKDGTITQADVYAGAGDVLNGKRADHLILRLFPALSPKAQAALKQRVFRVPDAPVSYPFLWDITKYDYVQWNGMVPNAGLGSVGRNAGEVIGTLGTMDWAEEWGFSLSSLISGQGFHATHMSFRSSVNVHNLRLIEDQLGSLQSPQWPADILPAINEQRRAQGEVLFSMYCAGCHATIDRGPGRRGIAYISRLSDIGTDPKMAANATNDRGLSGILKNWYVNTAGGPVLIGPTAPVADLLTKATLAVVATPYPDYNVVRGGIDWAANLARAYFGNEIKPSIKRGKYDLDTAVSPYASMRSYKARSLNGIWATAPYLHNGSVPTLYDLLLPKKGPRDPDNGEYRPDQFQVGSREFDPEKVGLKSSGYSGFTFDTRQLGNSNAGHTFNTTTLTKEQRLDLLEYLKSL